MKALEKNEQVRFINPDLRPPQLQQQGNYTSSGKKNYEMKPNKGLLDRNVIINLSKGLISREDIAQHYDSLYASIISYVETLGYRFTDEEEKEMVNEVLNQVEIINLNQVIADTAVAYRQRRKIKLADSLILATAKHLGADLRTSDIADFKNVEPDVRLVQPPLKSQ